MKLTRASDYAIRGVIYMAMQPAGAIVVIPEVAREMDVPVGFLARIFQSLSRIGIVISHRGKKGGYSLARKPEEITLCDVIEAVEGDIRINTCLDGYSECNRMSYCPVRKELAGVQNELLNSLKKTNFAELAAQEKAHRDTLA
ncbi:MAG: Rrf2 family transcriptional regulator [Deltaproteobacteria bacterium]|nr:Rrf2 family transcriptional regulator [Deltaproteobacteria bacterium]